MATDYRDIGASQVGGRDLGATQAPGSTAVAAIPTSASWATIAALAVAVITTPAAPSSSAWATNAATARPETSTPASTASATWGTPAATALRRYHNVTLELVSASDALLVDVVSSAPFTVEVVE